MGTVPKDRSAATAHVELDELKRRFARFVHRVDIAGEIAARPWQAVGLAAAAGAAFAFARPRKGSDGLAGRDKLVDAALSAIGVLALRAVRDVAWTHAAEALRRWWGEAAESGTEWGYGLRATGFGKKPESHS